MLLLSLLCCRLSFPVSVCRHRLECMRNATVDQILAASGGGDMGNPTVVRLFNRHFSVSSVFLWTILHAACLNIRDGLI